MPSQTQIGDEFDSEAPASELVVRQVHQWAGQPLQPYSFGRRILHRAIGSREEDPAPAVYTLGVLRILQADQATCEAWLFDLGKMRRAILDFIKEFPPEDYPAALELIEKILTEAKQGQVAAEPAAPGPQKKT